MSLSLHQLEATPTRHPLPFNPGQSSTLGEALDYAARGQTGANFYTGRGEIYGAAYDAESSPPVALEGPWVGPPEHLLERLGSDPMVLFGLGVAEIPAELRSRLGQARFAAATPHLAGAAGRLALLRGPSSGEAVDPMSPLYVRPPDALLKPRNG